MSTRRISLSQKIDQCVEEIRLLAPDHRFRVVHGYKGTILADSDRIGQVLTNLLINAMKYSERGSRVIVETKPVSSGVAVSVTDEGMGIPDNFLPKVFERFSRVDTEKMQTYPGMGLGLYIAAGIVARHGGTISVESREGMGSKFMFILPYKNNKNEKIN
ncbi:MAG: HAMP domain-containing histidine kinase [Chitinophagaceae bacterium]|nr:MAG: HAMP domain-containing histidine kinase [Chitinophagaceae bacterium]